MTPSSDRTESQGKMAENVKPCMDNSIQVDIGIDGIVLEHFPREYLLDTGMPSDGHWSVTWLEVAWSEQTIGLQRTTFRTLHAAAHYAFRIQRIAGALEAIVAYAADKEAGQPTQELQEAMYHAEAHAHECDAAYPAGNVIRMENGPSIIDDTGKDRLFMMQAPFLEQDKDEEGRPVCKECREALATDYDFG